MLTTLEAAKKLKVTRQRIIALIKKGRLKASKFGKAWMIEEKDFIIFKKTPRRIGHPFKKREEKRTIIYGK